MVHKSLNNTILVNVQIPVEVLPKSLNISDPNGVENLNHKQKNISSVNTNTIFSFRRNPLPTLKKVLDKNVLNNRSWNKLAQSMKTNSVREMKGTTNHISKTPNTNEKNVKYKEIKKFQELELTGEKIIQIKHEIEKINKDELVHNSHIFGQDLASNSIIVIVQVSIHGSVS